MKILRYSLVFIFIVNFLGSEDCMAQNIQSISGQVISSTDDFVMGNVLILNPSDLSLIKGTDFTDAPFMIEGIDAPEVLIKLSSILFKDTSFLIQYTNQSDIALGEIELFEEAQFLDEVTVTGKLPRFEEKADGSMELNVEKTSLSASNSLEEILSKTPGVILQDEEFQIVGKENTIYYVNGKRVTADQLALVQPANIKKIIIIRNPSAKYDADGSAVIDIKTIQTNQDGYQIKLKHNITTSEFAGTNMQTSITSNYAIKALKLTGSFTTFYGDERQILHTTRDRGQSDIFLRSDLTTDWDWDYTHSSTLALGAQYDLNPTDYVSIEYSGLKEKVAVNQLSNNMITDNVSTNFYESDLNGQTPRTNHSVSANYFKSLDTLGTSFFVGTQYSNILNERNSDISEQRLEQDVTSSRLLKNEYEHQIDIYSAQLDFTKFWHKQNSLELGAKISQVENDAYLDFLIFDNQTDYVLDTDLSSDYNYQERIASAYFNYRMTPNERWNYAIGLRTEFTNYVINLLDTNIPKIENNLVNFFPYAAFNMILPNEQPFSLIYSSSIRRPGFHQLNPVLYYQDPYTSIQGNVDLIPQKTHSIEAITTMWNTTLKLGYNYTIDPLGARALRGDDPYSYVLKPLNHDYKYEIYSDISKQWSNKWWTSINTINVSYTDIIDEKLDVVRRTPKPKIYFYTNNIFKLGNICNLELLYWYSGDKFEGLSHREDMSNFSITVEKSFFDKALNCRFIINDVFNTYNPAGYYTVGQTDIFYEREWSNDNYRLSISYNFGNLKKLGYKNKSTGKSEMNRAN